MQKFLTLAAVALLVAACNNDNENPKLDPVILDFESAGANYLAGPTSYGENLYADFDGEQYTGYTDAATGLRMEINESDGARNFWSGGVAISRWNDTTTEGLDNQCSVYAAGGAGGSETFAVVCCNAFEDKGSEVLFAEGGAEAAFDHVWITNSTYTVLSMKDGDAFAKQFRYEDEDWLLLTISAEDKAGDPTGTPVKFYLADFRTASSHGIVDRWARVDLTSLGDRVHKLIFTLSSSDTGDWGMNTPGYFCFDNLTFFK